MRQIVLLLLLVFPCFSEEIISGEICTISKGSVLLSDGHIEYSGNDSGSAITTSSASLWIAGKDEKVQIISPSGIISFNGTAYLNVTKELVSISVYKGYLRIISLGGVPGETVSAGYHRVIDASGEASPRELIASDAFDSLCALYNDTTLGCRAPLIIQTPDIPNVDTTQSSVSKIIVINQLTYATGLKRELDTLTIRKHIAELFISNQKIEVNLPQKEDQYSKSLELSKQENPFFIVDIDIKPLAQDPKSLSITIRIFSGIENNVQKAQFISNVETLKRESRDTFLSRYKSALYNNIKQWILTVI